MHAIKNALAKGLKHAYSKVAFQKKGIRDQLVPHLSNIYLKKKTKFTGIKRADAKWFIYC